MVDRSRLRRIQEKAKRVEDALPLRIREGRLPFGAEAHHYRLNAPLAPDTLADFEAQYDIRLPEEYRCFLLEIGDGGAGPTYGVLPLRAWAFYVREWDHHTNRPRPLVKTPRASYLASPSPLRVGVRYDEVWQERLAPLDYDPYQGAVAVCSQGCADGIILIVSGEARSRLVSVSEDWIPPVFLPMPDFLAWYETWQDSVLNAEGPVWSGYPDRDSTFSTTSSENKGTP